MNHVLQALNQNVSELSELMTYMVAGGLEATCSSKIVPVFIF